MYNIQCIGGGATDFSGRVTDLGGRDTGFSVVIGGSTRISCSVRSLRRLGVLGSRGGLLEQLAATRRSRGVDTCFRFLLRTLTFARFVTATERDKVSTKDSASGKELTFRFL